MAAENVVMLSAIFAFWRIQEEVVGHMIVETARL